MARRALAVASAAVTGVVLLAGCGSSASSDTTSGSGPGGGGGDFRAAFTAYTACMKTNGVTLAERGAGGGTAPSGAPSGGMGGPPSGGTMPSGGTRPSGGPGGGTGLTKPAGVSAATWKKATAACASLLPQFTGRGGAAPAPSATS